MPSNKRWPGQTATERRQPPSGISRRTLQRKLQVFNLHECAHHGHRTPFIIILILLLAITGVQYFFNFNGLNASAAMDQAQIARNVARGQGMATNWAETHPDGLRDHPGAGLNPFLSDAQIREQETILAGQGDPRQSGKIQPLRPPGHTQRPL